MALIDWLNSRLGMTQSVRSRILSDPFYRFQSAEEIAIAASLGIQIDANQAGIDDWLRLPGLSIHQARTLVALTQSGVTLHCLEDVAAVLSLPVQRLQVVAPVLQFCFYDPDSVAIVQMVNPNTATAEVLAKIPGIDLFLARAIVYHRGKSIYRNLADLQQRLGLPAQTTADLMHYLRF
jgi:DNA uptake protein ComE-like DNA-binding protein